MKTKQTKQQTPAPRAKGKLKLKNLKLTRETIENLSDRDAADVKGGSQSGQSGSRLCFATTGC